MIFSKEINYKRPIKDFIKREDSIFVCLFPFYKIIFADHYKWNCNLRLTYNLIETMSWKEILNKIGFNNYGLLALGLLELQEPFITYLKKFCLEEKLNYPEYEMDRIPEVILIPIIEYLIRKNHSSVMMRCFEQFSFCPTGRIELQGRDIFEIYNTMEDAKFLETENSINILIPCPDSPYLLLFGEKFECKELIEKAHLEVFEVDEHLTFDWWNENYPPSPF